MKCFSNKYVNFLVKIVIQSSCVKFDAFSRRNGTFIFTKIFYFNVLILLQYSEHKKMIFKSCVLIEACTKKTLKHVLEKMGCSFKIDGKIIIQFRL